MDEEKNIPYYAHEGMMARMERQLKRLFITIIFLIAALIITNGAWLYSWMQYDYESQVITADQDGRGINIVGGGDIQYGSEGNDQKETP